MSELGASEQVDAVERSSEAVRAMKRTTKVSTLSQVNTRILEVAVDSPSGAPEWEFFCECGQSDCHAQVTLTVKAFAAIRDDDGPVLAPGHVACDTVA